MNPVLHAHNLSFSYSNKKVLTDLSFNLDSGSFTALLGANGAGKTTLLSILSQFIAPHSGYVEYYLGNQQVQGRNALKSMGFVFQQTTLDLDLSVSQNLHYHAALHGLNRKFAQERIHTELGRMNMADRANEKVRDLNGGHKRRVEIARALLHNPSLLILDEPTIGLDMDTRESINKYIRSLCLDFDKTVLYTTHLLDEIQASDQVIFLNNGQIRQQGLCDELLEQHGVADMRALWLNTSDLNQAAS